MNFGHSICNNSTPHVKLLIKSVLTSQLPLESVNYNEISYSNQHLAHETGESQQTVLLSLPIFLRSGDQ